jgi:hypothetical protein
VPLHAAAGSLVTFKFRDTIKSCHQVTEIPSQKKEKEKKEKKTKTDSIKTDDKKNNAS